MKNRIIYGAILIALLLFAIMRLSLSHHKGAVLCCGGMPLRPRIQ